jgi:peptide methionine sulfoxide reductase MsrA
LFFYSGSVLTDEGRDKAAVQAAQEIVYKGVLPGQTGAEQSISVEYNPSYITLNHLNALEEFVYDKSSILS